MVTTIFCDNLKKTHEQLSTRGITVGQIQDGGDMQYFEIRDIEGTSSKSPRKVVQRGWWGGFELKRLLSTIRKLLKLSRGWLVSIENLFYQEGS